MKMFVIVAFFVISNRRFIISTFLPKNGPSLYAFLIDSNDTVSIIQQHCFSPSPITNII
jgi:hypothetical protein